MSAPRPLKKGDRVRVIASPLLSSVADVLVGRVGVVGDFDGFGGISVDFENGDVWCFGRNEVVALPQRKR